MASFIIKLNVGGTIFMTRDYVLKKSPILDSHIKNNLNKKIDDAIFIDEDPELFRHLLNYLRNSDYNIPNDINVIKLFDFYGIQFVKNDNEIVKLNVGGTIMETKRSTLNQLPVFKELMDKNPFADLFIDMHDESFKGILYKLRQVNYDELNLTFMEMHYPSIMKDINNGIIKKNINNIKKSIIERMQRSNRLSHKQISIYETLTTIKSDSSSDSDINSDSSSDFE